jgi:hypothetical protein
VTVDHMQSLLIGLLLARWLIDALNRFGKKVYKDDPCDCPPCVASRRASAEIAAITEKYDRWFVERSKES